MYILGVETDIEMVDFSCSPSYLPVLDFVSTLTRLGMI